MGELRCETQTVLPVGVHVELERDARPPERLREEKAVLDRHPRVVRGVPEEGRRRRAAHPQLEGERLLRRVGRVRACLLYTSPSPRDS